MLGHRVMAADEYIRMLRRHYLLLIIPAVLVCAGAYIVSLQIADRYVSQTQVLIEGQRVPESFVKSVVTGEPGDRLASMKEQILSRTRLQPIVERFDLFNGPSATIDTRVAQLQAAIRVEAMQAMEQTRSSQLPGFRIIVTMQDAHLAQQICSELTTMFINQNLQSREQQGESTTDFLVKELEDAKQRMNDQDSKLAEFKRKYLGSLPDEQGTNMNLLTGLSTQLDTVNQSLEREQQNKTFTEALLAQEITAWKASQQSGTGPIVNPLTLEDDLKRAQQELAQLQTKYQDGWPALDHKKQEIQDLKQKIAAAETARNNPTNKTTQAVVTAPTGSSLEPTNIQQTRAALNGINLSIQEKIKQQQTINERIRTYEGRLQISPLVEQQYKELTRDFATATQSYNELLKKHDESAMAVELERRQQGEQFKILDAANYPAFPSYPNRLLFAGGGLAGGLAVGLGLILLLEMRDKSIRTETDIQLFLKMPTLTMVPTIDAKTGTKGRFMLGTGKDNPSLPARV
jgi:polysaccharide chain length determinant protein (PEP-CTERM system associated)